SISLNSDSFGRGQMVFRTSDGSLVGATEPRADGTVATW
ncbi:MAG: Gamma-glutamyltranspeptidase, partial [Verrucomicrobiae bacterium]|nr:Gamma-glutamyltranspeptidase [Verrucomicrobiae bacterium]